MVGAGAALDAATRGLKVALVEARDFASGTSSRSSKMFHGGLRYLEQLEFGLVREALHERELSLTTLAPHLVKPLPFLFPLTKRVVGTALRRCGHLPLRPARRREIRSAAKAFDPRGRSAAEPGPEAQLVDRRHPLLRHRRRRRPAHHDGRTHRGALRCGGAVAPPRWSSLLREGDRVTGVRVRDSEDGSDHRGPRPRRRQRDRGVDRRNSGAVQAARPVSGARLQGRARRGAARPDRQ